MKVDKLLKRLENVKINVNKINEKREIAEYIAQKLGVNHPEYLRYFMTKDKTIYDFDKYENLLKSNKISSGDAYVVIEIDGFFGYNGAKYRYPFLSGGIYLVHAYLLKLGFKTWYYHVTAASGLKYLALVYRFTEARHRMVVEVADIVNAAINTNLPTLIFDVLGTKNITPDKIDEIRLQFISQKLFAGYDFRKAEEIIYEYFDDDWISFANSVSAINKAYNQIFQPYRVEYHLKKKQIIASYERTPSSPPPNSPYSEEE